MYLRRHRRKRDGVQYESWTVVESVRTLQGSRQRIVATLGKLPGLEEETRVGWEEVVRQLDGKAAKMDIAEMVDRIVCKSA